MGNLATVLVRDVTDELLAGNYPLPIPNSPFPIPHSPFPIPHFFNVPVVQVAY